MSAEVVVAEQPKHYATVDEVCAAFPDRAQQLLDALDLTYPGLEMVKQKVNAGDAPGACAALIAYYETQDPRKRMLQIDWPLGYLVPVDPELLFKHTFPYKDWVYEIPLRSDGGWDWTYLGPSGQDREFGWSVNRHAHLRLAFDMYKKTHDARYLDFLDRNFQDWLVALPPYPGKRSDTPQWRGLEVAIRLHNWPAIFYGLQGKAVSPATRLLMLMTVPDHVHYNRNFHAVSGNWGLIEMEGLSTAALAWPEFRASGEWWNKVLDESQTLIGDQVYPDGVQNELTSHYHTVVAERLLYIMLRLRMVDRAPSPEFLSCLESMWDYCAYALGPDVILPQNSDSDFADRAEFVEQALLVFDRPDWRYIITNGDKGKKPQRLSVFYPWAGEAIMRDGWDKNAQWAFFDMGPLGTGHYHFDKLHLSIRAGGRELLADSGRYAYLPDPFRDYVLSSRAHNVLLVDGAGQKPYENVAQTSIAGQYVITKDYDYFRGVFDGGYNGIEGTATHTRGVVYVRGAYWVVVDRIETDRPRRIEALWHFGVDCSAGFQGIDAVTFDKGKENLRITPLGEHIWELSMVKGQRAPEVQGWYSPSNNLILPSLTACYATPIQDSAVFVWVLTPGRNIGEPIQASIVSETHEGVTVDVCGKDRHDRLTIPLEGALDSLKRETLR